MLAILLIFFCQAAFLQCIKNMYSPGKNKWDFTLKEQWKYLFLPAAALSLLPFISLEECTKGERNSGCKFNPNPGSYYLPLYGNVEPFRNGHCYLCSNQGGSVYRLFYEIIPFFITVGLYIKNFKKIFQAKRLIDSQSSS